MHKELTPARRQHTTWQYARGANRALQVGLKVVDAMSLDSDQAIEYLRVLSAVLQDKFDEMPQDARLRVPFLESCANEALHRMNKG